MCSGGSNFALLSGYKTVNIVETGFPPFPVATTGVAILAITMPANVIIIVFFTALPQKNT